MLLSAWGRRLAPVPSADGRRPGGLDDTTVHRRHRWHHAGELVFRIGSQGLSDARAGAWRRDKTFSAEALDLPHYGTGRAQGEERVHRLVEALRCCDGVVLSSPAYHGAMPGMLKNALDYVEDLRNDARPYLDGRAVGVIVCANGAQAIGTTLVAVRSVIHALRGWPTPMGVGINSAAPAFDVGGTCNDPAVAAALATLAGQVVDFAEMSGNKRHRQNRTEPALV
jgi:FMN reductase